MGIPNIEVNLLAVLISAIIGMVIGALWYSPLLFGNLWMKLSGLTHEKINKMKREGKVGRSYLLTFIATLVGAYVLAHFVSYVGAQGFWNGVQLGFWAWLGFMVPITLNDFLWGDRSFKLFLLNACHHLVAIVVMAGILSVWK